MVARAMDLKKVLHETYRKMLNEYGHQGWWPLLDLHATKSGSNPTKTGSVNGYHPKDYSYPQTDAERFEICIGAILTQNTSWPNVEKALLNMKKAGLLDAKKLLAALDDDICSCIRCAGYYNQKLKKLRIFARFYISLKGRTPRREELLALWGIGPETCDSILLYAYKEAQFVVDTYTRRMLMDMGLIDDSWKYDDIKRLFEDNLPKDYKIYQEYHALIVEYGKRRKN